MPMLKSGATPCTPSLAASIMPGPPPVRIAMLVKSDEVRNFASLLARQVTFSWTSHIHAVFSILVVSSPLVFISVSLRSYSARLLLLADPKNRRVPEKEKK